MSLNFVIHQATHVGRDHLLQFKNRQDACLTFDGQVSNRKVAIGIVCDGCSEGINSETGALLGTNFLIREIKVLLEQGVPIKVIPNVLYPRLVEFLSHLVSGYYFDNPADRVNFIKNTLLFTVVGFIAKEDVSIIFYAGDGTLVIDDLIRHLDSSNRPSYPAYHLVDRKMLESPTPLPATFDTIPLLTKQIKRLAIGSDAWKDEPKLLKEIWGFKHPSGLQRRLNQWSKTDKRFKDDVTIITLEFLEPKEGVSDASNSGRNQDPPKPS